MLLRWLLWFHEYSLDFVESGHQVMGAVLE
jgi:hypothetical protein